MATLPGRHVADTEAVLDGEPGDYALILAESGEIGCLWFRLPTNSVGRIAAKGHGVGDEPEWTISVDQANGLVTVDPSIEQHAIKGNYPVPYWHGHLVDGVWED